MEVAPRAHLILIVEDDENIRGTLKMFLEMEDYMVATADNGEDALRMLRSVSRPCLILLDLTMPILNGVEFLTIIRTSPLHHALATIPVIIHTAELGPPQEALNHSHGLIKKPTDFEYLLKLVKKYCKKKTELETSR